MCTAVVTPWPGICMPPCANLSFLRGKNYACMRAGIVYGLYLTFSTWLLYFIATKTQFFSGSIKMFNLNDQARRRDPPALVQGAAQIRGPS